MWLAIQKGGLSGRQKNSSPQGHQAGSVEDGSGPKNRENTICNSSGSTGASSSRYLFLQNLSSLEHPLNMPASRIVP